MSVLIKGMKMPPVGRVLMVFPSGRVLEVSSDKIQDVYGDTEAVELPPHGRLIDADALTKMCREMQSIEWNNNAAPYSWAYAYESFENDIDEAPTIIEAEEVSE